MTENEKKPTVGLQKKARLNDNDLQCEIAKISIKADKFYNLQDGLNANKLGYFKAFSWFRIVQAILRSS